MALSLWKNPNWKEDMTVFFPKYFKGVTDIEKSMHKLLKFIQDKHGNTAEGLQLTDE